MGCLPLSVYKIGMVGQKADFFVQGRKPLEISFFCVMGVSPFLRCVG